MKFDNLPDFTAMEPCEVKEVCDKLGLKVRFNDLSNGRYDYPLKKTVRYKIEKSESGEMLVCDITGFPTLNYEQKKDR